MQKKAQWKTDSVIDTLDTWIALKKKDRVTQSITDENQFKERL
jgi:hypothetical protein